MSQAVRTSQRLPAQDAGPPMRLQRRCACAGRGPCAECSGTKKGSRLQARHSAALSLGPAHDSFEREADRAADRVVAGQRPSLAAGSWPQVQRDTEDAVEGSGSESVPQAVHDTLQTAGRPLDAATRGAVERRFGQDFSRVRIHDDAQAAASAASVQAHAYTVGSHIVFGAGRHAPTTGPGSHLLAHELAHVVQQQGRPRQVQREMYYGGGYKQRAYATLADEIASGRKTPSEWHPATRDMAATAAGSGGGEPVSTLDDLLKKIESKAPGSITRLNLIGHSNRSVFSFGGTITKDNVEFFANAALYADALAEQKDRIAALRDRFASGAKIVLYSCDAGSGQALLDAVADAFGVCVEGFTSEIWWCLGSDGKGNAQRGRVWAVNPNDPIPADVPKSCDGFSTDVTTLVSGAKAKACGAKKTTP